MGASLFVDWYTSAEFNNYEKFSQVTLSENSILTFARTTIGIYGNPTFTNLGLKIFSDNDDSKGKLLYTSSRLWTKADLFTLNNGFMEVYFEFPSITLRKDLKYRFSVGGTGATFTGDSHAFWVHGFPDPVYKEGLTTTYLSAAVTPYHLVLIGSKL